MSFPPGVLGPVDRPPCQRHRPQLGTGLARQGVPTFVLAPQLNLSIAVHQSHSRVRARESSDVTTESGTPHGKSKKEYTCGLVLGRITARLVRIRTSPPVARVSLLRIGTHWDLVDTHSDYPSDFFHRFGALCVGGSSCLPLQSSMAHHVSA